MIIIVPGHNPESRGAIGIGGVTENEVMTHLAREFVAGANQVEQLRALGLQHPVFEARFRTPNPKGYRQEMLNLVESLPVEVEAYIELHFDSVSAARPPSGPCALHHPGSPRGEALARKLITAAGAALSLEPRYIRGETRSWAGAELIGLTKTKCPAVILELCMGTNPHDMARLFWAMARGTIYHQLYDAIYRWWREGQEVQRG